ncbi:CarboxypepD_reg-like domain-containing protein [Pedobacter sp. ok626]|uniref:Plug and carboxypeptidase regulatory-like domain-containing protein n=1 Tax=Pedobacter sp. ok626 TaxID=1761882 RepID=UPI00088896D9|nr:Plug and carboxypeptidase regulatory-like domain-containing protein [Pedobacter sp. ok626]SDL64413.1 CarboxypepD_reg-like domain-containing protein [Pedobacter sp. ok626]
MQKKTILLIFLIFSTLLLYAQNTITINGIVKDSIGTPVGSASVTLINENGAGISFTKTDQQGLFNTEFQGNKEHLSLKITAIGYQQLVVPLSTIAHYPYIATLKKAYNQLSEVTVKSKSKISLSSDTLKYNVSAFKDKNDRVIADLIGRLPGIQVDDNGAISYNGKRITSVYVDGDNLLDGKYRTATNNVPVDAVEQVQVIERDQPIKALNGYMVANNISLNLKLADHARTITINTGFLGLGNKAYVAELNNLIFKKKIKSINNLKVNNIGQNLQSEHANIGVSFNSSEIGLKTPRPYLSMMSERTPTLAEKYHLINNDNAGNINALYKLKSDWDLRLNIAAMELKRNYNYNNSVNYFLPNADTVRYNEIQHTIEKLSQWQIGAQIEKNSNSIYLKSNTKLNLPKWDQSGGTSQNNVAFKQIQPTNQLSLSNETNLTKAMGVDHVLQYNSVLQFYKMNENLKISPGVQQAIVNDSIGYLMLSQQVRTKNLFINQSATYKTKFDHFIFSASLGAYYEHNTLNSDLYKTDSLNIISTVGKHFENDVVFENIGLSGKAALIYKLQRGSLSLETTPTYSLIKYNTLDAVNAKKNTYFLFNPIIEFRNKIGKYSELDFRYSRQTSFGEITDIYPGNILVSYRQFSSNDIPLPKTDLHVIGARYAYRKPIKMLFYFISLNYDRTGQNFINSYVIDSGVTKAIAIDYKNVTNKYAFIGNISKYLFSIATSISASGNIGLQQGNSLYNNEISPFNAYSMNLSLTARKKILSKITISLTGDLGKFINEQNTLDDPVIKSITRLSKLKTEWQHNLSDQVGYTIAYNFTSYQQALRQMVNNSFLDLNLKYSPAKWKSFFELQCINLINQNLYQQINSDSNQLSTFQLPLRPRTLLLKYSFTF